MVEDEGVSIPITTPPEKVLLQIIHDFRAPVNALTGYATVIQQDIENAGKCAEQIQKIAENLQADLRMVEEYLRALRDSKDTAK